jgi:hypothetical protein
MDKLANLRWFLATDSATLAKQSPKPLTVVEADAAKVQIRLILADRLRREVAA